jgi:hypothetical protein
MRKNPMIGCSEQPHSLSLVVDYTVVEKGGVSPRFIDQPPAQARSKTSA